jgi:hypothetical protein
MAVTGRSTHPATAAALSALAGEVLALPRP